jgi:hypothetical protein
MSPRLLCASVLIVLLALPAGAAAAGAKAGAKGGPESAAAGKVPQAEGPARATVKIVRIGHLRGGRARIYGTVPVIGSLRPFKPRQHVEVTFYLNGHRLARKTVSVHRGSGESGVFRARIRIREAGRYAASARHAPTALLGGDSTVRKSWRVSFPALHQGQCGDVVVGFKRAMRKLGYIANGGRCFGGKTARGVLAYRRVNGMSQSFHAGRGLVKRVFAGRGGYHVVHPDAGTHLEASLSKQVLVFATGDRATAIYPISSGKPSTPTVTGHFTFYLTQPGYNAEGMYYSFYFHGGYAVHGYYSVPNYAASHGCIRTFIADQPEIFNRIDYGESIFVF